MPKDTRTYQRESEQFGTLQEASSQVYTDFEPANDFTENSIIIELAKLGLALKPENKHHRKKICATCDFIMSARYARNGLIIWLGGNDEYVGAMYSAAIARDMRNAFIKAEWMRKAQDSSKKDKLARVYKTSIPFDADKLSFKQHGKASPVVVKSRKERAANGKISGGKRISPKKFGIQYREAVAFVKTIISVMTAHPLTTPDGQEFSHCKRIFNNDSLKRGGRLYGPWQQYNEKERLEMTIDGEPVCEIDLKASYLNLANILFGDGAPLQQDPYETIGFVAETNDPERKAKMRALAKKLVSAIVGNESGNFNRTSFPKGEKYRDKESGKTKTISVRKEFDLPKSAKAKDFYSEIFKAYPFLERAAGKWAELMYLESQIILGAVHKLAKEGIATYPVHDSLICKYSTTEKVTETLHEMMNTFLGTTFHMDVSMPDESVEVIPPLEQGMHHKAKRFSSYWGMEDDDISLIEED